MPYLFIIIILLVFIFFFAWKKKGIKQLRHERKISTADRVIKKLQTFSGSNREAKIMAYLKHVDCYVFEEIILSAFEQRGFKITRNKKYSGDGGFDGKIESGNCVYYIQAKRYRGYINNKHVSDFQNKVCKKSASAKGLFIHTGKTGQRSYELVDNMFVKIISGKKLIDLICEKDKHLKFNYLT